MVFSSEIFLFLFLPLFLGIYWLSPQRVKLYLVLAGSLVFYGWWQPIYLLLLLLVIVTTYYTGLWAGERKHALRYMAWGVTLNLTILVIFKYANFLRDNLNLAFEPVACFWLWQSCDRVLSFADIALPIGISFFIFQGISYVVDMYRGDAQRPQHLIEFAAFMSFFPQLIAGPVLRYKDLATQFRDFGPTLPTIREGAMRFWMGFCKKVLIADTVAVLSDSLFLNPDPTFLEAWLALAAYSIQLYFDFSGYSDMAIGLGLMVGFRFPENFRAPYLSLSITEFWRRWHISLSTWLRDYLYIPLGGSRGTSRRTYINLFLTMLLGGIWHGAGWPFVIWGAWHGSLLAAERFGRALVGSWFSMPRVLARLYLLIVVMWGWAFFNAGSLGLGVSGGWRLVAATLQPFNFTLRPEVWANLSNLALAALAFGLVYSQMPERWIDRLRAMERLSFWGLLILFTLAVLKLNRDAESPFLYFQF